MVFRPGKNPSDAAKAFAKKVNQKFEITTAHVCAEFDKGNLEPLIKYLKSGTHNTEIQTWLANLLDSSIEDNKHRQCLGIQNPTHRKKGSSKFDDYMIARDYFHGKFNPSDERKDKALKADVAKIHGCSESLVAQAVTKWRPYFERDAPPSACE